VLALSINCFDGQLPESMCAAADTLTVLSADGLGASSRCTSFFSTPFFGVTLFNGLGGSVPSCLFAFEKLEILHLSGNGLVGSLAGLSNNSVMRDLSITHNRIRGKIPSSIQRNIFALLDLSYNDLSGTYTEGRSTNESEIILQVNRLSGNLKTDGLEYVSVLNILKGNFFGCADVPENDEYFDDFSCGSSDLNNSLYFLVTSIFIAGSLFTWFAIMYRGSTGRTSDVEEKSRFKRIKVMTQNFSYYLSFVTSSSSVRKSGHISLDKIAAFCDDLRLLSKCVLGITLASFVIFLPVYLLKIIDDDHSSHEHQYKYLFSITYATGQVSASLVIGAWTIMIMMFAGIAYILDRANKADSKIPQMGRRNISMADPARSRGLTLAQKMEQPRVHHHKRHSSVVADSSPIPPGQKRGSSSAAGAAQEKRQSKRGSRRRSTIKEDSDRTAINERKRASSSSVLFYDIADDEEDDTPALEVVKAMLILLVNLLIVGAVNSWYLQFTLGDVSPTERLSVQLAMAVFKSIFAVAAVPVLASSIVHTERNILLRLLMAIFNTLLIPLAVTAFTSSSCLEVQCMIYTIFMNISEFLVCFCVIVTFFLILLQ
jgi:hypothetical protein